MSRMRRVVGLALALGGCVFDSSGVSTPGSPLGSDDPRGRAERVLDQRSAGKADRDGPSMTDGPRPDAPGPDTRKQDMLKCGSGQTNCGGVCVNLTTNPIHCGACGKPCAAYEPCVSSSCVKLGCADGSDEQTFQQGMRGCAGKFPFVDRATLCASGFRVCTAAEWVARRGGVAPQYNYWTDDNLNYKGSGSGNCYVAIGSGSACTGGGTSPMRICVNSLDHYDPLFNVCNWINCGFNAPQPIEYFGGCNGNLTAGAICCPK